MKRIALLLCVLLICGCTYGSQILPHSSDSVSDYGTPAFYTIMQPQFSGGYLYFLAQTEEVLPETMWNVTVPYRYHPVTGNLTAVCPDPLCDHRTEACPFFGIGGYQGPFYVTGGRMLFQRTVFPADAAYGRSDEVIYNPASGKLTRLREGAFTDRVQYEMAAEEFLYYYDRVMTEAGETQWNLYQLSLATGKERLLNTSDSDGRPDLLAWVGDRMYYRTDAAPGLYVSDMNLADAVKLTDEAIIGIPKCDGEFLYFGSEDSGWRRISLTDGTSEALPIAGNIGAVTENWIYYMAGEDTVIQPVNIHGYSGDTATLPGSEIRRCRHDGTGDEAVFRFEGEFANTRLYGMTAVDDFIFGTYYEWKDHDGDGIFEEGDNGNSIDGPRPVMKIDVPSGRVTYLSVEQ